MVRWKGSCKEESAISRVVVKVVDVIHTFAVSGPPLRSPVRMLQFDLTSASATTNFQVITARHPKAFSPPMCGAGSYLYLASFLLLDEAL